MARDSLPTDALRVTTYQKLEEYLTAFAQGHMNLIILVGRAGLAKSRTVRKVLGEEVCWISGQTTPMGMYLKLFQHRDSFVVIDDVDSLYADRAGIRLLKSLCQTEAEKTVAWQSAARTLQREGVPREFRTRSRVLIIANDWRTLNRNVEALQDRGHVLVFEPTAAEVHCQTQEWFRDEEVRGWFEMQLPRIETPSMRLYVRALELKRAGMNWTSVVPTGKENWRHRLVAELKADTGYPTEEARVREFRARGGGCRATYFNYARRMAAIGRVGDSPVALRKTPET